eukprot:1998744-Prymnesium_polylepis.1
MGCVRHHGSQRASVTLPSGPERSRTGTPGSELGNILRFRFRRTRRFLDVVHSPRRPGLLQFRVFDHART